MKVLKNRVSLVLLVSVFFCFADARRRPSKPLPMATTNLRDCDFVGKPNFNRLYQYKFVRTYMACDRIKLTKPWPAKTSFFVFV